MKKILLVDEITEEELAQLSEIQQRWWATLALEALLDQDEAKARDYLSRCDDDHLQDISEAADLLERLVYQIWEDQARTEQAAEQ